MGRPLNIQFAEPPQTNVPPTPPPPSESQAPVAPCPVERDGSGNWTAECDFDGDSYIDTLVFTEAIPDGIDHSSLSVTYGNLDPEKIYQIKYVFPRTFGMSGYWRVSSVTVTHNNGGTQFNVVSSPGPGETGTSIHTHDISFNPHNPKRAEAAQEQWRQLQQ